MHAVVNRYVSSYIVKSHNIGAVNMMLIIHNSIVTTAQTNTNGDEWIATSAHFMFLLVSELTTYCLAAVGTHVE